MAEFKIHCSDCEEILGEPFKEVHIWLDEFAKTCLSASHRRYRHHKEGVEEVRKMWGDRAAEAAEIHILKDLYFWGEIPSKDEYNRVEAAYMNAAKSMFM